MVIISGVPIFRIFTVSVIKKPTFSESDTLDKYVVHGCVSVLVIWTGSYVFTASKSCLTSSYYTDEFLSYFHIFSFFSLVLCP